MQIQVGLGKSHELEKEGLMQRMRKEMKGKNEAGSGNSVNED